MANTITYLAPVKRKQKKWFGRFSSGWKTNKFWFPKVLPKGFKRSCKWGGKGAPESLNWISK
jgi:hypothetical protein